MALITKIEVSNFLNTKRIDPWDPSWHSHWPHVYLVFDGKNGIGRVDNGRGKTRVCDALFTILTRDRTLHAQTKTLLAPSRKGLSSHIRIEVKQQLSTGDELFESAVEHYVIGLYGCYDTEINFYLYQGQLSDCPVAFTQNDKEANQIKFIPDKQFKETLKKQKGYQNRNRAEYLEAIGLLFDMGFLQQQLNYQKSGGGDGTGNFFTLKSAHPKGHDFSTSFFYEHIAPHLLVDVMGSFAEDDEKHFVDTLVKSSRKVIALEFKQDKAEQDRDAYNELFTWLSNARYLIDDYQADKQKLHEQVNQLHHQLMMINRISTQNPLERLVGPVDCAPLGENQVSKQSIANQLSYHEGEWLISDMVLAQYLTSSASSINKLAHEKNIIPKNIKSSQVIDISRNLAYSNRVGGHKNNYYSCNQISSLFEVIGENRIIVAEGKDYLSRSINYGFNIRNKLLSPNPFEDALKQLENTIEAQKNEKKALIAENDGFSQERNRLQHSIERFELNQQAYMDMSESGFFSAEQLSAPANTKILIEKEKQVIEGEFDGLMNKYEDLSQYRTHFQKVKSNFGDQENYTEVLSKLKMDREHKKSNKERSVQALNSINEQIEIDRGNISELSEDLEKLQKRRNEIAIAQEDYKAVRTHYSDNELALEEDLQAILQKEIADKSLELDSIATHLQLVSNDIGQLEAVREDYQFIISQYQCDNPKLFFKEMQQRKIELDRQLIENQSISRQLSEKIAKIPAASQITMRVLRYFESDFPDIPLRDLAHFIDKRFGETKAQLSHLETQWCEQFDQVLLIEEFESNYDSNINQVIGSMNAEYRNKSALLEQNKQALHSLIEQHERLKQNGEITPSNLVRDIHTQLDFVGETVHQVICSIELPEDRLKASLKEFSSVLHAPVVETESQAIALFEKLINAGKDYPVFYREKLTTYCRETSPDSALLSYESLHVKVLTNADYLPTLLSRLEEQIEELTENVRVDERALQRISPESNQYTWLQSVKLAYDENIEQVFIANCKALEAAQNKHDRLYAAINAPEFHLILVAQTYQQHGGDAVLYTLLEQQAVREVDISNLRKEEVTLNNILTETNISRFQNAIRYEDLGGDKHLNMLRDDRDGHSNSQQFLLESIERLKEKEVHCYVRLPGAQRFVKGGGVVVFESLEEKLIKTKDKHDTITQLVEEKSLESRTLAEKVSELSDQFTDANGILSEWKLPLEQSSYFLEEGGPDFDKTYEKEKKRIKSNIASLQEKLHFNFDKAQSFIDATQNDDYNVKLVRQIQTINESIVRNDNRINELSDKIEANLDKKPKKETDARKYQEAYIKFQRIQGLASDLLAYLNTELDITYEDVELSPHTKYAIDIEKEIRAQHGNDYTEIAELYLNLFDAVECLGLNEANTEITTSKKHIEKQELTIKRTIQSNLEEDKVVREAERQELSSNHINRVISTVKKLTPHIEQTALDKDRIVERTAEDVRNQKQTLANNMVLLTNTLKDNLKLMKSALAKGTGQAGFVLDANVISDEQIQQQIEKMIASVRLEEERFQSDLMNDNALVSKTESQHIAQLQEKLKLEFNRSVFVGSDDRNNNLPTINVIHPQITADRLIPLSLKFSVGQRAAIGLLLLVKLAIFNSERVNSASTISRAKRSLIADKVVIIDGLFSNLSDEKMINDSLEMVRNIKDDFQIIGWLHNPTYKNNFDIFPCLYNISPVNSKGILMPNKIIANHETQMIPTTLQVN